jgi:hypothetical protein
MKEQATTAKLEAIGSSPPHRTSSRDRFARTLVLLLAVLLLSCACLFALPAGARADVPAPTATYSSIRGLDRYDTAIKLSRAAFPTALPAGSGLVLAPGETFPEALCGSPLAAAYGGPVLLSPKAGLVPAVRTELQRLAPKYVFCIGFSTKVVNAVKAALPTSTVNSITGANVYAMSHNVAHALAAKVGTAGKMPTATAIVTRGDAFPDAIAVSSLASAKKWPILLTGGSTSLPMSTRLALSELGITQAIKVGTYARLPVGVTGRANLSGANRYVTNANVATWAIANAGLTFTHIGIATGDNYPDALASGPFLAKDNGLLLLSPLHGPLPPVTSALITANRAAVQQVTFIAMIEPVVSQVKALLPVKAIPSVTTWPTASAITQGQALSASTLTGGTASVPGAFAFTSPSTVPASAGTCSAGVTFTPTDSVHYSAVTGSVNMTVDAAVVVLQVKYQGTLVKSYTMAELKALTPFAGIAGYFKSGTPYGPDAVTGTRITDIVADARGTALTATQAVTVAQTVGAGSPFSKTFSYDRLVNFTGFTMYSATSPYPTVPVGSLTGPLAAVLVYGDPAGAVMPTAKGPLRFFMADGAAADNVVMSPANESVGGVDTLNITELPTTIAAYAGDGQSATVGTAVATAPSVLVTDANHNPVSGVSVTFAVASGGGSATGTSATTDVNGIAAVGSWTLGATVGANTLTATSAGLTGSPVTFSATAIAANLSGATIAPIADQTYTGSALTPDPVVTSGATTLTKDIDYTVGYADNTNVGTATLTVTGQGNYSGTKSATFQIVKATPSVTNWPSASAIARGQELLASTLSGGAASVPGTFAFSDPSAKPTAAGTYSASVIFTPTDTAGYNTVAGSVNVTVNENNAVTSFALKFTDKAGTVQTLGTWSYDRAALTFRDAGGTEAPFVKTFDPYLRFSGCDSFCARLAVVKKGILLDDLASYAASSTGIPVTGTATATGWGNLASPTISNLDTRYYYPSYAMLGSFPSNPPVAGEFDESTRVQVPAVLSILAYGNRNLAGTGNAGWASNPYLTRLNGGVEVAVPTNTASLDNAFNVLALAADDDRSLRTYMGQAANDAYTANLGRYSGYNTTSVKLSPVYLGITADVTSPGGLGAAAVTIDDGYLKAAATESVSFTVTGVTAGYQISGVSVTDAVSADVPATETGGTYTFTMPSTAATIHVVLTAL